MSVVIDVRQGSSLTSDATEEDYLPDWFNDSVQGAVLGVLGHMLMESCESMHRDNPESLLPYVLPTICFMGGVALEAYTQSKIGKAGAVFFGSLVASKLPYFNITAKHVQIIVAAATGAGVKRLIDKIKWFG